MKLHLQIIPAWVAFAALLAVVRLKHDPKLAQRLRRRDPKAMTALYDRYGRLVYALIHRIVKDAHVAEDLTQETFLRVWNRAQAFDTEKGALGPWIVTVARNRAIDYLRSTPARSASRTLELADIEHPSRFTGIDDEALAPQRAKRVQATFDRLTPHQKTVLELAYYEGLTPAEMAERLQEPLATVQAWLEGALNALRESAREAAAG